MKEISKKVLYSRQWRLKNPDKVKKYNKDKYDRDKICNPERLKRKQLKVKEWMIKNRETHREYQKKWSQNKLGEIKNKIFDKLGNSCKKCGYSDKRALCIDHKNGGGYKEIRSLTVFNYYKKVLEDTSDSYQILCHNCNWIKRSENNEVRKPQIL